MLDSIVLPVLRARQMIVERECIAIQVVQCEFTRTPRGIADASGTALDAALPVFFKECVWVLHDKAQANCAHLVLELKLHV